MYYERYADSKIAKALHSSGAVLVAGPKFCGKTTTCMQFQKSFVKLNTRQEIQMAKLDPGATLKGETPRLIDEWQTVPDIWNQVKANLDEEYVFGKFLLTGSSTPADKTEIHHSGAGRITPVVMRPMSLWESKESSGEIALGDIFRNGTFSGVYRNDGYSLSDTVYLLCRGGWPISVLADREFAIEITRNYYNSLFIFEDSDNERFRNLKPEILRTVMRSYARNISSEASIRAIISDIRQSNERSFDEKTFASYFEGLKDLFIISEIRAWSPSIRSKTSIRATPTRHLVDTSLACCALNVSENDLLGDIETCGLFFEDFAIRDLSIYADALGGELRHYRDNAGLECDAVIHLPDGRWGAVEIKLGGDSLIDAGAASLLRLKSKIEEKSSEPSPAFLMVLTGMGPAYRRPDGVLVVPINKLKA